MGKKFFKIGEDNLGGGRKGEIYLFLGYREIKKGVCMGKF